MILECSSMRRSHSVREVAGIRLCLQKHIFVHKSSGETEMKKLESRTAGLSISCKCAFHANTIQRFCIDPVQRDAFSI